MINIVKKTRIVQEWHFNNNNLNVDIHPTLYHIEWLINYYYYQNDIYAINEAREILSKILTNIDSNWLIKSNLESTSSYFRSDIIAQILRAWAILLSLWYGDKEILNRLVLSIEKNFLWPEWAISFFVLDDKIKNPDIYRNVRSSMFTSQAFWLFDKLKNTGKIDRNLLRYII